MWWVLGLAGIGTAWINSATESASNWFNTRVFGSPNITGAGQSGQAYFDKVQGRWVIPVAPSGTDWSGVIKLGLYVAGGFIALKAFREVKWLLK